ncbi:integrase catalytic domain-containing protein [Trichonephila clavipes]|nr:integrase catalytic domain-containing protein [Trichonephila clavipes]
MSYPSLRQEKLVHLLFGGISSKQITRDCYKIWLMDLDEKFACNFDALDQDKICEDVQPVCNGYWIRELKEDNIILSDSRGSIDILIRADIMGKMLTGKRRMLKSGLVEVETHLGWTLMGKVPEEETPKESSVLAITVTSMFVNELDISNLWRLDLIGIDDPIEKKSKQEIDLQTKEHFLETVKINCDGRYEVCLTWADDKSPLPDNLHLAQRRLEYTISKLKNNNLYLKYEEIFASWLKEGIIEVPLTEIYASVIDYHIRRSEEYDVKFREKLDPSFYVDNVVTSVENKEELKRFIQESTTLVSRGRFELREWEYSGQSAEKAWKKGIRWDEDIKCELRKEFLLWFHEQTSLKDLEVPRYVQVTKENLSNCTIHTFVDGSQDAYAAVVFLRIEKED